MLTTQKLDMIEKNWLQIWIQHPKIILNLSATKILLNSVIYPILAQKWLNLFSLCFLFFNYFKTIQF